MVRITDEFVEEVEEKLLAGESLQMILAAVEKHEQAELLTALFVRGNVNIGQVSLEEGKDLASGGFLAGEGLEVNTAEMSELERIAGRVYDDFLDGDRQVLLTVPRSQRDKVAEFVLKVHHVDLRRHLASVAVTSEPGDDDVRRPDLGGLL